MADPVSSSAPAVDRENPWPGLASFTEDAREFFFGRESETDELSRLVRRQTLTVLFGQSGLGKSSLLQAGLFPLLRTSDHLPFYLRLDHDPSSPPLADQVKAALVAAFLAADADAPAPRADETLWEYFHRKDIDIWSAKNRLLTPVLAFDQFEEMFTLGRASEAARERSRAFLTELTCLVENRAPPAVQAKLDRGDLDPARFNFDKPSCQVILSLREDFLPDLEGLKSEMPALIHNRLRLKRLNGTQALEIVTKPGGHLLADGVAERIVEFVAGARGGSTERLAELDVEPPLLSVICRELNDRRRALGQDKITADLVSGNRREILHDFYERSVADLPDGMRNFVEDHLLTKSGFRDNLALETALEFPGVTRPLLDTLVARRLLRIEDRLGVQRVELTHDVLAEVIRAARDERQQRLALAASARRSQRQRWIIGGLATAVAGLLVGAFFGIRAQRKAEQAQRDEAAQSSRTDFIFGSQLLEQDKVPEGLAYLVRAARSDPTNNTVGPRLISALAYRSFAEPVGLPLTQPTPPGRGARYTHDGRHFVTFARDHVIRYWELESGRLLQTIDPGEITDANLSPDGKRIATSGVDGSASVWDLESGRKLLGPLRHEQKLDTVAFSPDGRWLGTGGYDRTAKIWDATTGELKTVLHHDLPVNALVFSPDSGRVLTVSVQQGMWQIWRVTDGVAVTPANKTAYTRANWGSFSPDGKLVVIPDDRGAQMYDAGTAAKVGPHLDHTGPCYWTTFAADGKKLVTTSNDATARLWEVPTGKSLAVLPHAGNVNGAHFTPDDRFLITDSGDGAARVWDLKTVRLALEPIRVGDIRRVDLSPDGHEFMTNGGDGVIRRWRAAPGAAVPFQLPPDPNRLRVQRDLTPGAAAAWVIYRDRLQKIDPISGHALAGSRLLPARVQGYSLSPDASMLAITTDAGDAELWDLRAAQIVRHPIGRRSGTRTAFSGDSSFFTAVDSSDVVRVWNTRTGALASDPLEHFTLHTFGNAFSSDGRLLALGNAERDTVFIRDLVAGAFVSEPIRIGGTGMAVGVNGAQFSPNGRLLATAGNGGTAQLWDTKTTRPVGPPLPHRNLVRGVAFTSDGKRLMTWTPLEVRVWDVATGAPLTEPMAAGNDIFNAVFSPDDTRIATRTRSTGEVRIWGSVSGQLLAEPIRTGSGTITSFGFLSSGEFLAVATNPGAFAVWAVPPESGHKPAPEWLLRLATAVAGGEIDRRGVLREGSFTANTFDEIRRELTALPDDAPYVGWGRWFLSDRATRSIAPGFTITPAEAEKLAAP